MEKIMETVLPIARQVAERLKARRDTVGVAESSAGGLISAALLAVPGASAYYMGGTVVYTRRARRELLGLTDDQMASVPPGTEALALLLARAMKEQLNTDWAVAEIGATGPTGTNYGYGAGHGVFAVVGPDDREAAVVLETASPDREANMRRFAIAALELFARQLAE
jgi:nicotinamide-nucleotide amidase